MERIDNIVRAVIDELREAAQGPDADALLGALTEMRRRAAWRQYACAALASGACTCLAIDRNSVPYLNQMKYADLKQAAQYADAMLKLERERFGQEETP